MQHNAYLDEVEAAALDEVERANRRFDAWRRRTTAADLDIVLAEDEVVQEMTHEQRCLAFRQAIVRNYGGVFA